MGTAAAVESLAMTTTSLANEESPARSGRRTSGRSRVLFASLGLLGAIAVMVLFVRSQVRGSSAGDSEKANPVKLTPAPIDGERAYGYLKTICALGPRLAGTVANTKQRNLVARHFKAQGAAVREQPFNARHPLTGKTVRMVNLIGSWHPERTERVVIAAHYDTRPYPDQEQDPRLRNAPFLGANDCASGVALLMEMANHMKNSPTPWGVDFVLLDGEELVYDRTGEYFLGSKAFAKAYSKGKRKSKSRYVAGIVLDMVGGKNLELKREPYSEKLAPKLLDDVWEVAAQLDARSFREDFGREVLDDHLPLNDAGIPTIDIIDFEYPHWHTAGDVPENCSPASLAEVGRVVTAWLAKPKNQPNNPLR
jgi:hypothetical protein